MAGRKQRYVGCGADDHAGERRACREFVPTHSENEERGNLGQDLHLQFGQTPEGEPGVEGEADESGDQDQGKDFSGSRQARFIGAAEHCGAEDILGENRREAQQD